MSININCPHCNQGYTVSENMIGRSIICKKCNNMITVEDVRDYDDVEVVEDENQNYQQENYQQPQVNQYNQPQMQQQPNQYQNQNQQYQQGQYPPPYNQQGQYPPPQNQYGQYPQHPHGHRQYAPMQQKINIPNNMVWAILSMLFCFLPTGIVALIYSTKVDSLILMGDYYGARDAAAKSRKWAWISFAIGIVVIIINIAFITSTGANPYTGYPPY